MELAIEILIFTVKVECLLAVIVFIGALTFKGLQRLFNDYD